MKEKLLVFEPNMCIGCRLCEQICSTTHFKVTNPKKSRIRIIRNDEKQLDQAIYCHNCADAKCISACEFNALFRDSKTNAILVSEENCVACRKCIEECPYNHPVLHPSEDYILICDLCNGSPACVEICPENAIQYLEKEKVDSVHESKIIREGRGYNGI